MEVKRALVGDRASQVLGTRCSARSEVRPSSAPPPVDDELVAEVVEIPSADEGSEPRAGKGRTRALNELALANSALPPETPGGGSPFSLEIGVPDRQFITHSRLLEQMALKGRELVYQRAGIDQLRNRHHGGQRGCERYHPIESRADLSHTEDSRPSDPRHYAETLSSASPELNPHDGSHAESQSHPVDAHPPTTLPLPLSP